ncbi:MAG: HNH endonuclease [archaeon]
MKNKWGYKTEGNPIHRIRAYNHIYLMNRKKYPLQWGAYEVHHIDGDRDNNRMDNLAVLTPEEHDKAHDKMEYELRIFSKYGTLPEDLLKLKDIFSKEYNLSWEKIEEEFHELSKEFFLEFCKEDEKYKSNEIVYGEQVALNTLQYQLKLEEGRIPIEILKKTWKELLENYKEEKEEAKEEAERKVKRKELMDKIKKGVKKGFKTIFKKRKK